MANKAISQLPAASAANDTDQFPVNQSGTTRRLTVAQLDTHLLGQANTFALGQTIRGHSAIGAACVPNEADTYGTDWVQVLNVTENSISGAVTDLTCGNGFGLWSAIRSINIFDPVGAIQRGVTGFDLEMHLKGAGDYDGAEGYVGGAIYEGTGTVGTLNGLDFIANVKSGAAHRVQGLTVGANVSLAGQADTAIGANINAYAILGGDVTTLEGLLIPLAVDGDSSATTVNGVHIENDGVAHTTTLRGLYIENMTGAINNYAIVTDGGETRHKAGAAAVTPLTLQLDASQSADAFAVLASNGTTKLARIDKSGYQIISRTSAPADAALSAGEVALWFDSTNGLSKLMVKGKSANGTVVSGSVVLT
jgi:hypothetical protein